ncbi:MAG: histidine phosphatase family protein [Actinomycetota bacterium]
MLLVRHGATEWNVQLRAQGQADIGLNDLGRRQALETAEKLAGARINAVYSSDLSRAFDTAAEIAARHGLAVQAEVAFREIDQGEWTGLSDDEIKRRWPDRWGPARHYSARPGGESPTEVRRRALAGLERVVGAHPEGAVVVVSHGATIRTLVAEALGLDERTSATLRGVGNGGVVCFDAERRDGRLVLDGLERMDESRPARDDPNQ